MAEQEIEQLRDDAARQRQAIAQDFENVGDRVSPGRIAERRRAVIVQRVGKLRNSVFGTPDPRGQAARRPPSDGRSSRESDDGSLQDKADGAIDSLKDRTPDSATDFAQGNPMAAGLIGLGIGLLAATLLPESREEQRIADEAQGTLDSLAEDLAASGREAADNLKPAAQEAAQQVKESARDSAESVKGEAKTAAQDVKDEAEQQRNQING